MIVKKSIRQWLISSLFLAVILPAALPAEEILTLASTTSTLDTGFFDAVTPVFEKKLNCKVKVIAVGTGQAIRLARDGNADLLLVHDKDAEEKFVADGFGVERLPVMHNDFLVVGPSVDGAKIKGDKALAAFQKLAKATESFVSRGDESGTHKKEQRLWKAAGAQPGEKNYLSSGSGMEATLRIANEKKAYCLVDRGTWLAHKKELDALTELVQGDPDLFNPYSVIVVSDKKYPQVKTKLASSFVEFIRGEDGQKMIREFGRDKFGAPLFFPDVIK